MAKEAVGKFVEAINKSTELTKKCKEAMQGSKDGSGFAALGKANGFDFTAGEAAEFFKETLGASRPKGLAELDEADLAKAAGGKSVAPTSRPDLSRLVQSVQLFRGLGAAPGWTSFV